MTEYIDIDSAYRNRDQYSNPANFVISPEQMLGWNKEERTVRAFPQNPSMNPKEFVDSVKLVYLQVPYAAELSTIPRLYVTFYSLRYKNLDLIKTMAGKHREAQFICIFDKYQLDDAGNRRWINYKCDMTQVMRFNRTSEMLFQVTTRSGDILTIFDNPIDDPLDVDNQILATISVEPYIRDGDYDNHFADTTNNI